MRFIIPKGQKVGPALENLKVFLDNSYAEYPFAAGNINIYFNLSGRTKFPESENNKQFVMDKDGKFVDSATLLIEETFRDTFWRLDSFIKNNIDRVNYLQQLLLTKEECRRKAVELPSCDELKRKAWDIQIANAKREISEAFELEEVAAQLKKKKTAGEYIKLSRVMTFQNDTGALKGKTFKDCIAVLQFEGLQGLRFDSCFFVNGKDSYIEGRFEDYKNKHRFF